MSNNTLIMTIFSKIDVDRSGFITQPEMDAVFTVFDKDGNGIVSKCEWVQTFESEFGGTKSQAESLFGKLDKDGSGDICLKEVSQLFKDMDSDGNGHVSKEEFLNRWQQVTQLRTIHHLFEGIHLAV